MRNCTIAAKGRWISIIAISVSVAALGSFAYGQNVGRDSEVRPSPTLNPQFPAAVPQRPLPATGDVANVAQPLNPNVVELTRGPVHEGFAEMASMQPHPVPAVPGRPPEPIREVPATIGPETPDAQWLPGYWHWDADTNGFLWVSGTWRVPPPGFRWVPGYWTSTASGSQWVAGFWLPENLDDINYLPAPPDYPEEGVDPGNPPAPDLFWIPGVWLRRGNGYAWTPGYWARMVPGWIWIADHYEWTPSGYVYIAGYWDYPLEDRGTLYAPVVFQAPVYLQPTFTYSPDLLVDLAAVADNLFINSTYNEYFFGDYYDSRYLQLGFRPWFTVGTGTYLYDPIYTYRSWHLRERNPHWREEYTQRYDRLVHNPNLRPLRSWREHERLSGRAGSPEFRNRVLGIPARDALRGGRWSQRFANVARNQHLEARHGAEAGLQISRDRARMEAAAAQDRNHLTFRLPTSRGTPGRPSATGLPNGRQTELKRSEGPQIRYRPNMQVNPNTPEHQAWPGLAGRPDIIGGRLGPRAMPPARPPVERRAVRTLPESRAFRPDTRPNRGEVHPRPAPAHQAGPAPRPAPPAKTPTHETRR